MLSDALKSRWIAAGEETAAQRDPLGLAPIPEDKRRRFLQFRLAEESKILLPLHEVVEVLQLETSEILPVPEMPSWILGVCNWRGEVLWLTDLNTLVGNSPLCQQDPTLEQLIAVIVQSEGCSVGLVVNQVDDVEQFDPEHIHQQEGLYSAGLAAIVAGYLPDHKGIVLDVSATVERSRQKPP
ncbi:MAG: chemotaxis protein CheW [Cyanobacteria bacterium P01_C01_bin.120]